MASPAMLNVVLKLPPELTVAGCVTPLSVTATSSPPGAVEPAAMCPVSVTVDVPALTAGEETPLNVGVALLMTREPEIVGL